MKITTTPRPPPPKKPEHIYAFKLNLYAFSRTGSVSRALEYRGGGGWGGSLKYDPWGQNNTRNLKTTEK